MDCKAPVCWVKYTPTHLSKISNSRHHSWPLLVCPLFRFSFNFNFRIPINITDIFEVLSHILWFTNTSFSHGNKNKNINFFNNNKYFNFKNIYNNIRVGIRILDLFGIWIVKVCPIIKCSVFMPWSEYLTGIQMVQTKWHWNVWIPINMLLKCQLNTSQISYAIWIPDWFSKWSDQTCDPSGHSWTWHKSLVFECLVFQCLVVGSPL